MVSSSKCAREDRHLACRGVAVRLGCGCVEPFVLPNKRFRKPIAVRLPPPKPTTLNMVPRDQGRVNGQFPAFGIMGNLEFVALSPIMENAPRCGNTWGASRAGYRPGSPIVARQARSGNRWSGLLHWWPARCAKCGGQLPGDRVVDACPHCRESATPC